MGDQTEQHMRSKQDYVFMVITAVLAGSGTNLGFNLVMESRPDPSTGTEAKQVKFDIMGEIYNARREAKELTDSVESRMIVGLSAERNDCRERVRRLDKILTDVAEQQDNVQARLLLIEREMGLEEKLDFRLGMPGLGLSQ